MKILDLAVYWFPGSGNAPDWRVLVDVLPDYSALVFKRHPDQPRQIFAETPDGYVGFAAIGDENARGPRGFSGRKFIFKMDDGSEIVSTNVWSSRAGAFNQLGFTPCASCVITDRPEDLRGGFGYAGALTLAKLEEVLAEHPICYGGKQVVIYHHEQFGEPYYTPSLEGMDYAQAKDWLTSHGFIIAPYRRKAEVTP